MNFIIFTFLNTHSLSICYKFSELYNPYYVKNLNVKINYCDMIFIDNL